jgi:hypothetical protein
MRLTTARFRPRPPISENAPALAALPFAGHLRRREEEEPRRLVDWSTSRHELPPRRRVTTNALIRIPDARAIGAAGLHHVLPCSLLRRAKRAAATLT